MVENGWENKLMHDMLTVSEEHLRMYVKKMVREIERQQGEIKELRERVGAMDPETESEQLEWSCVRRGQ